MAQGGVPLTPAERRTEAFIFGMFGSLAAGLAVWFLQNQFKATPAASAVGFTQERSFGIPKSDIERAMNHYGITEEEYIVHPEWYPLPERGSRIH